ncbi:MAG: hypothetical protein COU33_01540 [Candidatus Magasanikbacteria bacterium CG10_big_fil_rev_8_21_14_0_10_43_6]|uniref:VTC domain-containing protein n=1 Tax=Candidatus Magasanikbacteria bacterium CG10_big_fil_rev_8_21_14_0_10_43_6 TaxID=1974650 RepID=A0A2M6W1X1_9BACT|nr:MAG: hypothetical protein COU33_01540 [Candidatus Magasanikbacteria bacterium CG10_big_fil_rev_8_21_14_0_10_43_6]
MSSVFVNRFEYKYFLSQADYMVLKARIGEVLQRDPYAGEDGTYRVRSLYFDTLANTAYYDKIDGVSKRAKVRMRMYNGDLGTIKLEIKEKHGDVVRKISSQIDEHVAQHLIQKGIDAHEFDVAAIDSEMRQYLDRDIYKPVVMIEYIREAFWGQINDVRITFDSHVKKKEYTKDFLHANAVLERAEELPFVILEVKFNTSLPPYISRLLTFNNHHRLAISKYCLSRELIY